MRGVMRSSAQCRFSWRTFLIIFDFLGLDGAAAAALIQHDLGSSLRDEGHIGALPPVSL